MTKDIRPVKEERELLGNKVQFKVENCSDREVLIFLANLLWKAFIDGEKIHPARNRFAGKWYSDVRSILTQEDITGYE